MGIVNKLKGKPKVDSTPRSRYNSAVNMHKAKLRGRHANDAGKAPVKPASVAKEDAEIARKKGLADNERKNSKKSTRKPAPKKQAPVPKKDKKKAVNTVAARLRQARANRGK